VHPLDASQHCTDVARVRFRGVTAPRRRAPRGTGRAVAAVVAHPSLWSTALRQAVRTSRPRWWRRPPFLPVPDPDYLRFRLETQYGADAAPDPDDVLVYLRWCREHDR
jgi:hypothetical protein